MSIGHLHNLYSQDYDYEPWSGEPLKSYFIASTPRSGSTLLSLQLWKTGLLGGPAEYFNLPYRSALAHRLRAGNLSEYRDRLIAHRTSPNGVFGCKLFWSHYVALHDSQFEFLSALSPIAYVFLTRDNKTAQAVSLSRAMQTRSWVASADKIQTPKYVFKHIMKCREYIRWQEAGWINYFREEHKRVITVSYENLIYQPQHTIKAILEFIHVDDNCQPPSPPTLPPIYMQGGGDNNIWEERFNEDCERLGVADLDFEIITKDFPDYVGDWSGQFPSIHP